MSHLTPNIQKLKNLDLKDLHSENDFAGDEKIDNMFNCKNYFKYVRKSKFAAVNDDISLGDYGMQFMSANGSK